MKYSEDHISVYGDMMFCSGNNYSEFTAGTIEIKGDFTQKYSSKTNNFYASGNHCVILNGNALQKISFKSKKSKFNILEIQNISEEGVVFLSEFSANNIITNDCNIQYYDPDNDYVLVNGNVYHYSSNNYNYWLTKGLLELKVDFVQYGDFTNSNEHAVDFKLLLSGASLQTISVESGKQDRR